MAEITQLIKNKRRIVVGDIHGELAGFREILRNAALIDAKDRWIGGDCILIQTGDVIDRGPCSREVIDLLRSLQKEASDTNSEVIRLCGNHELMLLQKYYFYTNFDDPDSLRRELIKEIASGDVRASFTDGERLYTHAGLRSAIREILLSEMRPAKRKVSVKINLVRLSDHINRIFADCVKNDDLQKHPIFHVDVKRGGDDPVGGIFWCDFSSISPSLEAWLIPQIFGHTPNGIKTLHGLKLINVDAGMCHVYGGKRVYLEITAEGDLIQNSKSSSRWVETTLNAR